MNNQACAPNKNLTESSALNLWNPGCLEYDFKIPFGTKFAVFTAICKNKFQQIKITANIFPAKIYSWGYIL